MTTLVALWTGFALAATPATVPAAADRAATGVVTPADWKLSGQGRVVEDSILEVSGGDQSSTWRRDVPLAANSCYRFRTRARRIAGSGSAIAGPAFANRDYFEVGSQWTWLEHVFRTPPTAATAAVRLGHWQASGPIQFDRMDLVPVVPVHRSAGAVVLGDGESLRNGVYRFVSNYGHEGGNDHRVLLEATAGFNSNRWNLSGDTHLTYRFAVEGLPLTSGTVQVHVGYHVRGQCLIDVSADGKSWRTVATQNGLGSAQAAVPADLLPAAAIFVRLGGSKPSGLQVHQVEFEGRVAGRSPDLDGGTWYADVETAGGELAIAGMTLVDDPQHGGDRLRLAVENRGGQPARARVEALDPQTGRTAQTPPLELAAGGQAAVTLPLPRDRVGPQQWRVRLTPAAGEAAPAAAVVLRYTVPDFHRTDYGALVAGAGSDTAGVWWCEATRKVPRQRTLPAATSPAARLWAARRDFEAVQVVVAPRRELKGLTARLGPLSGPQGATIAAERTRILRVHYHLVEHPTDATGVRGLWPDALPPLSRPIDVPAGVQQPLWVLVHVPADAAAGDYAGTLQLRAEGWSAEVPIALHVWNFTLPAATHQQSGYGLSLSTIAQYHQLKTEADKRRVWDLYLESFADHRISPYIPAPLDPIRVKFLTQADPPRVELDFTAFDAEMTRVLGKYRFNSFQLPLQAMGGGTFHERHDPKIGPFAEDSPQYQALFASYVQQLEAHLRDKGWLGMAYVYWFDEPDDKDFAFVRRGMERLKKYAPGLRRMLTKEPRDALLGSVDLWCPLTNHHDPRVARQREAQGERSWWYVCTGPKAPYCTLFIDHPATELRVWLWQTWQRGIDGTLVWQTNYWTSTAAYPTAPQNPYDDPMGYVSGYSTPRGVKRHWGNGDGRFLYPPEAAAVPGHSGTAAVLEPPVSSLRWEMLREGIEDHEYLVLLRRRLAERGGKIPAPRRAELEALLAVPAEITRDLTTFTTDPAPIYRQRERIARAIEELGSTP